MRSGRMGLLLWQKRQPTTAAGRTGNKEGKRAPVRVLVGEAIDVSSRLFQEVREKRGLAYSIYSFVTCFTDSGLVTVYAGVRPDAAPRAIRLILKELRRLQDKPVGRAELERAKSQLKGNLMLGLESTSSRMSKLAKDELYFGCHIPLRQVMADIDAISADQLWRLSRELFDDRFLALTALGSLQKGDVARVMQ